MVGAHYDHPGDARHRQRAPTAAGRAEAAGVLVEAVTAMFEAAMAAAKAIVDQPYRPEPIIMNQQQYRQFRWVLCEYGEQAASDYLRWRGVLR
jgi:hypothetical protein